MDPPSHRFPACARFQAVNQPWYDDAGHRADTSPAPLIPYMPGNILLIGSTTDPIAAAKGVYFGRTIRRPNVEPAIGVLQRLQKRLAEPATGSNRDIGIIGKVRHAMYTGDFAVQEISHEEGV